MPTTCLSDLHQVANMNLKAAMLNERSKRWKQVVQNYRRLLRMLDPENLPPDYTVPHWFAKFLYEVYYHLGLALQHLKDQQKAAQQFTKAIDIISTSKNGCTAGCTSSTCLLTPVYARRALAYGCTGHLVAAKQDAERAIVLDAQNPDVFCVRALVCSSMGDERQALQDVNKALRFNHNHPSALILRGNYAAPLSLSDVGTNVSKQPQNKDHTRACDINPDCFNYLDVQDFKHPLILTFYDRLLYSLGVPHTIAQLPSLDSLLNPDVLNKHSHSNHSGNGHQDAGMESRLSRPHTSSSSMVSFTGSAISRAIRALKQRQPADSTTQNMSFKCGTPICHDRAETIMRRRKQYGRAIRDFTVQPQTAQEYIAMLQQDRPLLPKERPPSAAITRPEQLPGAPRRRKTQSLPGAIKTSSLPGRLRTPDSHKTNSIKSHGVSVGTRSTATSAQTVQVFQPVNVKDAPRMYYKPWSGDRLPVGEKFKRTDTVTPFVV